LFMKQLELGHSSCCSCIGLVRRHFSMGGWTNLQPTNVINGKEACIVNWKDKYLLLSWLARSCCSIVSKENTPKPLFKCRCNSDILNIPLATYTNVTYP
jgi:hypothetical protein